MTPDEALARIQGGESATVELKPESEYQTTLAEALAALANAGNEAEATIFVGVQDAPILIRGVSDLKAVTDRLYSAARQVHPALHDLVRVEAIPIGDKTVVAAHVPPHLPGVYHVAGRYLARRGTQNLPLTPQELLRLLHERGIFAYEDQAAPNATLADLDPARVAAYLEKRAAARLSPLPPMELSELLDKLGLLAPGGVPTVAALLFFGRDPQRLFPHMVIRAVRFPGEWTTDLLDQAEIGGTVPELIDGAYQFVWRNIAHGAAIHGLERVPSDAYPAVVVREAIANAVAHRDLAITNAVIRVFIFSNRIEIDSPGGLLPGLTPDNIVRLTRLRNRRLAELLYQIGYIERQGTGLRRMIAALRAAGQPDPVLENFGESLFVTLYGARAPGMGDGGWGLGTRDQGSGVRGQGPELIDHEAGITTQPSAPDTSYLVPRTSSPTPTPNPQPPTPGLNIRERRLLSYLRDKGAITRAEYEAYFQVGTRTAKRDLTHLQALGLVALRGSSTASYYVLAGG